MTQMKPPPENPGRFSKDGLRDSRKVDANHDNYEKIYRTHRQGGILPQASAITPHMCNLYHMTKGTTEIARLFEAQPTTVKNSIPAWSC
jgi:hypothetical protein